MKKWLTIDAFICAFLSAMGYGFGYTIPCVLGAPNWLCIIICFACGLSLELLAEKIIYSRFTQEKLSRKLLIFAAFIAFFVIGNLISIRCFDESLVADLKEEFGYVVLFAVLGYIISLVRHHLKVVKVKAKYGDGEEGFRFDSEERAYIEGLNRRNAEINAPYDASLAVRTRTGVYVGFKEKGVLSFNGIPYAQAPIGGLRWKAPEALPDSDRVFEAKHFGPSAIQPKFEGDPLSSHQQSEDCLYLNVCTADTTPACKKPVVVYFHGGDFSFGGSANPLWEMNNFVKEHPDVVTISFNYRLGFLGFVDLSQVPGGENYPDAVNLGLLDQIAALEWIRENIAAFGGDPKRITAMGDGAGGVSISLLSACARAKGLFSKAIIFSGNPDHVATNGSCAATPVSELLKAASATNMDELLALPESRIRELAQKLRGMVISPTCDGKLIPKDVAEACEKGIARDVDFVLCASANNAAIYGASIGRGLSENIIGSSVENILGQLKPQEAEQLRGLIGKETERIGRAKAEAEFMNLWLDHIGQVRFAEALCSGGSSVHMLYWDVEAIIRNLGSGSVNVVSMMLSNDEAAQAYGSVVDAAIRDVLQALVLKLICDEEIELYSNEVDGIDAIQWDPYPRILAVSRDSIQMKPIESTLADAKELLEAAGIAI